MGLFLCDLCDQQLGFDGNHFCATANIRKKNERLEKDKRTAERRLDEMQNAVLMLLKELPSLAVERINVDAKWLRRLWDATQGRWDEAKTADEFLSHWLATHRVLCEAYDVFRTEKYGHPQTLLQKLTDLRIVCDSSKKVLGYEASDFDMTPEDLVGG